MSVWTEELLEADLAKISAKDYTALSYSQSPEPTDPFLRYRYEFLQLLDPFERNDFARSKSIATKLISEILDYLSRFDPASLASSTAAPPFDLMLLAFMNAESTQPNYSLLVKLFRHYVRLKKSVSGAGPRVFLSDRTRSGEIAVDRTEAVKIVQGRIDYLAELVAAHLYSSGQHQLLSAFLTDFAGPTLTNNEETLSQLGRIALACGDGSLALSYFKRVTEDKGLVVANQGYISYFGSNFTAAKKEFSEAKGAGPANADVCLKYTGQGVSDPVDPPVTPKRQTPEEKTQWPLQPKA
jgi:hypothetical protein